MFFFPNERPSVLLSIMILPSDEDVRAEAGQVNGGGNVTQPFVTETYRCMAPYETKDTKNKPFKVALDEKVDVLIKDQAGERAPVSRCRFEPHRPPDADTCCVTRGRVASGWWLVENEDKKMAWFPAPYLEKLDEDDDADDEDDGNGSREQGMCTDAVSRDVVKTISARPTKIPRWVNVTMLRCIKVSSSPLRRGVHCGQELQGHQG